jgi:hypothetical protein
MKNFEPGSDQFSNDRQENLRIENEILKIKMQAEHGAIVGVSHDIPPEIEHEFLRSVEAFEQASQIANFIKVYDFIGRPEFRKAADLSPAEVESELNRITDLLKQKNIILNPIGNFEPMLMYKFITEELFDQETEDFILPGWCKNFIYEEFQPDE